MKKTFLSLLIFSSLFGDDIVKSMQLFQQEQLKNISQIHHQNDAIVKSNRVYYGKISAEATKYYQNFISKKWGADNVKLSNISTFVQYDKDMKSRQSINFQKGIVTIEVISDNDKTITPKYFDKTLDSLSNETIEVATTKDPVISLESKYMVKKNIVQDYENKQNFKFLDGYIEKKKITKKDIKQKIVHLKDNKKKYIYYVDVKMVPQHLRKRALEFKPYVLKKSAQYGLEPSVVFATIQTESYFNPLAKSNIPAYGLMQIVPTTAGIDAYYALTKKKKLLSPTYLYNSKNNIELGAKYIQIIRKNYLKGITSPTKKLYCAATAYNAGIGSLFRSFTGSKSKRKEAIAMINSMTSDEVYKHLRTSKLLTLEARNYVKLIRTRAKNYHIWDKEAL